MHARGREDYREETAGKTTSSHTITHTLSRWSVVPGGLQRVDEFPADANVGGTRKPEGGRKRLQHNRTDREREKQTDRQTDGQRQRETG